MGEADREQHEHWMDMKWIFTALLAMAFSASAQNISYRQLVPVSNYIDTVVIEKLDKTNGVARSLMIDNYALITNNISPLLQLKADRTNSSGLISFNFGDDSGQLFSWRFRAATNTFMLQDYNSATDVPLWVSRFSGDMKLGRSGSQITNYGNLYVLGSLYDGFGRSYVTTIWSSNAVQLAAGSGTVISSSGSGGVQTYTITSTAGSGATNAIATITTNGTIAAVALQSMGLTNTSTIDVSVVSNSLLAQVAFSLSGSYQTGLTNLINTSVGTVGTNATNFGYSIGTAATNYANAIGLANSNLSYAIGTAATNYGNALGTALTNNLNGKADASTALSQLSSSGLTFPGSQPVVSNLNQLIWNVQFTPIPTNSALSNLTVNLRTNKYFITLTNNLTLTNFTGLNDVSGYDVTMIVVPQLINRTVVYPTLGTSAFSVKSYTNSNTAMWTTLTNGSAYAISVSGFGTNLFWAITEWK